MRDPAGWFRPSSGNHAFDEYRTETLRRLEEEQREFKEFLERLRFAKDKTEFDQFMAERRNRPARRIRRRSRSPDRRRSSRQQAIHTLSRRRCLARRRRRSCVPSASLPESAMS